MTGGASAWNLRGKTVADPDLEKSAYIVFAEFCSATMIQINEIKEFLPKLGRQVSVFHLSDRRARELAGAMGVNLLLWNHARGADLLCGRTGKRVFLDQLRYCPLCLAQGQHSTLFQLTQVTKCPIHIELLRTGCPHCRDPISTNVLDVARNHLHCGACGRNLAPGVTHGSLQQHLAHPSAKLFAPLRKAIGRGPQARDLRSDLNWDKRPDEVVASPILTRLHHVHSVWGDDAGTSDFLKLEAEYIRVDVDVEGDIEHSRQQSIIFLAMQYTFEGLASRLRRIVELGDIPQGILTRGRVDEQVSAVTAAFWQAALVARVDQVLCGSSPILLGWQPWFSRWLPAHIDAKLCVLSRAVRMLFVRCLIRMVRLRYGVQVAWHSPPDWFLFLPPWRLVASTDPRYLDLQIRRVVAEHMLERLVLRYREHQLLTMPTGASPLELIAERPV
ncbi:hypothetical protein [Roseateles toxinivorans]|uniref:TniQ protein n=1 Tax=Roseateles toxinivorans TaxID=270368 RepID=A0A4V6PV81_9BURK|nr:hypothetical protein [Roseateles toxinivorans]TDP74748.1 hypothetical protein DES47_101814 [Roseateles toxinivorans]